MSKLLALAIFSVYAAAGYISASTHRKWGESNLCGLRGYHKCRISGCRDPYTQTKYQSWRWDCWGNYRVCMYEDCVKPGECAVYMYEHENGRGKTLIVKGERAGQNIDSYMRGKLSSIRVLGNNCNVWIYPGYGATGQAMHFTRAGGYNFYGHTNDAAKSFRIRKKNSRLGRRREEEESSGDAASRLSAIIAETGEDFDNEPEEEILETEWGSAVPMTAEEEEGLDLESGVEEIILGEDEKSYDEDDEVQYDEDEDDSE